MGSLSKVQIVKDNKGTVDYDKFADAVNSYLKKSRKYGEQVWYCDITPKFDGCSFEVVIGNKGNLLSVSTRGDGEFGKDIKSWFVHEWNTWVGSGKIHAYIDSLDEDQKMFLDRLVIRHVERADGGILAEVLLHQLDDAVLETLALVVEDELGAGFVPGLGDAECDAAMICYAGTDSDLACQGSRDGHLSRVWGVGY